MDISSLASCSTALADARAKQTLEVSVLKKAIDSEAEGALQLLAALGPSPAISSTGGTAGQVINVEV